MKHKNIKNEIWNKVQELRYLGKTNNLNNAFLLLEQLKEEGNDLPIIQFEEALLYYKSGDTKKALFLLKDLIDSNRINRFAAMYEYVKISLYNDMLSHNIKTYCEILLQNNYKTAYVELMLGRYYEKNYKLLDSKEHYIKARELGNEKAETRLANVTLKLNNSYNFKSDVVDEVFNKESTSISEIEVKIKKLKRHGSFKEIYKQLNSYERRIKLYRNDNDICYLVTNYLKIGYVEDAKRIMDIYGYSLNNDEMNHYLNARLKLAEGLYKEAILDFKEIINSEGFYSFNSLLFLSKIASYYGDYEKTRYYYELMEKCNSKRKDNLLFYKLCLDIKENKYDEARECYELLSEDYKQMHFIELRQAAALLGYELDDLKNEFYSVNQILNYDINQTANHIVKHTYEFDIGDAVGIFKEDVDIEQLLEEVMNIIEKINPIYFDVVDHYIIHYPNIGNCNEENVDYIEVVTISNTKKIITMYPVASDNIFSKNFKNKKDKEDTNQYHQKVKRKTQLEKFYEKYGNYIKNS